MRILASNPDTIGDMVLRQPLYRALIGGGHELTLIVRKSVERIARMIAPEARILLLPAEVYSPVDARWDDFAPLVAETRALSPDILLVAPFQWTRFEERLAADLRDLPGLQVVGMTGRLYGGDPFAGASPRSQLAFDRSLAVDEDVPEADKNALLADMLGCPVPSVEPVLSPDESSLAAARAVLADRGLSDGSFWIACVTGTANVPIKAWPPDQWAAALKTWHERYGRKFLFVGLPAERSAVDLVLSGMGGAAERSAVWMEQDGDIATLAALASLSAGYVGHDTGPMHLAAAVGKPVLAIFGGGHKLRFVPRVAPSVVLSVRVPCAGCGWACSFDKAWCVAALRPVDVLRAVEDLEVGRIVWQDVRLLPLPADVHDHMTGYAADLARDRLRLLAVAQRQLDSVDPHQLARLTLERNTQAQTADELTRQLAIVSGEVQRLHAVSQSLRTETGVLSQQLQDREQAVIELRQAVDDANQRTAVEAAARKAEVEPLRREIEQLRHKVSTMEPPQPVVPVRPRRTWRELLIDVVCGKRHYVPKNPPRPMPKICLVTVVRAGDREDEIRRTLDSVTAERYPHLDYAVVLDERVATPTQESERAREDTGVSVVLSDCVGDKARIVVAADQPFAAVADVFARSDASLVAWLDVGLACEPGALHRIGEFFRDHSMAMAAVQEETEGNPDTGWRFGVGWPAVDVDSLRNAVSTCSLPCVIFRREPYNLLGQLNPARGDAAGWDLLIRFSRRFGIRRVRGHGAWRFGRTDGRALDEQSLASAKAAFEATYGIAGRVRTATLRGVSAMSSVFGRWSGGARWKDFDLSSRRELSPRVAFEPRSTFDAGPGPQPPAWTNDAPAVAINPVTRRCPQRLLFSAPDATTDQPDVYRVYFDGVGDAALASPPIGSERLEAHRTARSAGSPVVRERPIAETNSPYRRFRSGPLWARLIASFPCPYWRLAGGAAGRETGVDRLLALAGPEVSESEARALVIGSHDGQDLDALKSRTKWTLTGVEPDASAAERAQAKGHRVFRCNPQDAFMTMPDGEMFDLIYIPSTLEHWDDPVWMLRRLLRMLSPSGRIVVRTPNLDSMLLRRFGPTWWFWQPPYHRIMFGRRGLRMLAEAADLKIERVRTATDAHSAAASVQLNQLGLAGVTPDGATFEKRIARRGAKCAGWARLLWDRWGRGDEMWAVLRPL